MTEIGRNDLDAKASPCSCRSERWKEKERINQMSENTHREGKGGMRCEEEEEKQDFLKGRVVSSRGPGRA